MDRILGVDYGERRIGLALSDPSHTIAMPWKVVEPRSQRMGVAMVADACREASAERIVVGLPLNMNGTRGPGVEKVERFAAELRVQLDLPVDTWDERMTSRIAERVLLDADVSRARRREVVDKLAAQGILQGYLDAHASPPAADAGAESESLP